MMRSSSRGRLLGSRRNDTPAHAAERKRGCEMQGHEHHAGTQIVPHRHEGPASGDPITGCQVRHGDELELASRRSPSGSETPRYGCSPTTAHFLARPSRCRRAQRWSSTSKTWRHGGHRPLARAAAREPVRRDAPDPGADGGWGDVSARVTFPDPGPTGTTRTSARTTGRRWACTATCSWSPPSRILAAGSPRPLLTLDDILLEDGKVAHSAAPRRPTPRWAASETFSW